MIVESTNKQSCCCRRRINASKFARENVNECKLSESFACFDWKLENCACECCCKLKQLVNDDYRAEPSSGRSKASPRDKHRESLFENKAIRVQTTHRANSPNILFDKHFDGFGGCLSLLLVRWSQVSAGRKGNVKSRLMVAVRVLLNLHFLGYLILRNLKERGTKNVLVIQISI